jgi:hypothetical protein
MDRDAGSFWAHAHYFRNLSDKKTGAIEKRSEQTAITAGRGRVFARSRHVDARQVDKRRIPARA